MTGLQGIVDAGANVVHASSRSDVDGERKHRHWMKLSLTMVSSVSLGS